MKVGPHVMTHSQSGGQQHRHREVVPRVGSTQAGGNLKLIQCQLMLLLHARRCEQRHELMLANHRQPSNVTNNMARALLLNCPIRHCRAMKEVLHHMKSCRLGSGCTYQHCTTSLRILSHWTNCTIDDCPLCQCVRQRMRRAKEWEATLPRSSRYTLLAAALRSSQTPRPVNCHASEQAQEGQSGVPCATQDELHNSNSPPWNGLVENLHKPAENEKNGTCDKRVEDKSMSCSTPSLEQVRKAYEQLGIPCPEEALLRLMATLPSMKRGSVPSLTTRVDDAPAMSGSNQDQGVFDCFATESSPSSSSTESDSEPPPSVSSTTASPPQQLLHSKISFSSRYLSSRPK